MITHAPNLQRHIAERLTAFSEFGGIAIITQYEGSINTRIEEALATITPGYQPGLAILIATPAAQDPAPNVPAVRLDPFGVTLTIIEDAVLNEPPTGSGRRALDVAILTMRALKGWTPPHCQSPLTGWGNALTLAPSEGARIIWHVTLKTRIDLPPLRLPGEYGYTPPNHGE